jgi:hypothetical protein
MSCLCGDPYETASIETWLLDVRPKRPDKEYALPALEFTRRTFRII